jgi:DNA primase
VAAALGLEVEGRRARCYNGAAHEGGADDHPSLVLFPDSGRYKCFACGAGGDAIDLVRGVRGLTFPQAVSWLTNLAGGRLPEGPATPAAPSGAAEARRAAAAAAVYGALYALTPPPAAGSPAGDYLLSRGLDPALAAACGAREALDGAAVWDELRSQFPEEQLRDAGLVARGGQFLFAHHALLFFYLDGERPAFVQARDVTGRAACKEIRPAGVPCPLPFNACALRGCPDTLYVCEGCVDTLSAVQLGLAAVGVPGVQAFRDDWFPLFRAVPHVAVLFDDDEAGRRNAAALRGRLRLHGLAADAVLPAHGKDVNELLRALRQGGLS